MRCRVGDREQERENTRGEALCTRMQLQATTHIYYILLLRILIIDTVDFLRNDLIICIIQNINFNI
jgi:hypothetical protein